jgi:hypothetical protein
MEDFQEQKVILTNEQNKTINIRRLRKKPQKRGLWFRCV